MYPLPLCSEKVSEVSSEKLNDRGALRDQFLVKLNEEKRVKEGGVEGMRRVRRGETLSMAAMSVPLRAVPIAFLCAPAIPRRG